MTVKTKEKILNAALDILLKEGFHALTQTHVAESAGVRQGLLTYHFPKRNDLLRAVVDESRARMKSSVVELDKGQPTLNTLKEIMSNFALSKTFPRLMLALTVAADEDPSITEWFVQTDQDNRQKFREALQHMGWQVEESALHLMRATIVGAALINLQQKTKDSEERTRHIIDTAFQHLVNNLKPI